MRGGKARRCLLCLLLVCWSGCVSQRAGAFFVGCGVRVAEDPETMKGTIGCMHDGGRTAETYVCCTSMKRRNNFPISPERSGSFSA